ncbi:MAG: glycosyltransferase family 4 protein [Gammaproteobacteria bacterium]
MIRRLPHYNFYVHCWNTDIGVSEQLPGIRSNQWQAKGPVRVFYASKNRRNFFTFIRMIRAIRPDVLYVCSFFAKTPTMQLMLLHRLGILGQTSIILAPHGEFSPGALRLHRIRKRIYLGLSRRLGLYRSVIWHACSVEEADAIRRVQGPQARIILAPNFPPVPHPNALTRHLPKQQNLCRLVFLSRISLKKNLVGALQALSLVSGRVEFDIYGPIEDSAYWVKCQDALKALPSNVTARYCGAVDPDQVETVFSRYDALFLPTWGENYGYAIVEAWAAATPVLISDCTPWRNLESDQAGWTAAPDDHHRFASHILTLVMMNEAEHARWRTGALARAATLANDLSLENAYVSLFQQAFDTLTP